MWIPPEVKDPVLLHHPTRANAGYFGAVRLKDGRFVFRREDDTFNKETFFSFMRQLKRAACRTGRRVIVITDNANYHHANLHKDWRLTRVNHFKLSFLPPYCPDLNQIERAWKLTRCLCLHNRHFPILEDIVAVVENQFRVWSRGNATLKRLCAIT